ncbi:hypothetical protein EVAR_14006_1 [Eumeta japonica]|uniref:Uncharacterized protein n=1 Tax=Eumeta variegata TaxID=151549 RepID=A0A4C1XCR9_EUMVA|nr:hypothetical protein EVAR_14006_1 [Eumeta japonica]
MHRRRSSLGSPNNGSDRTNDEKGIRAPGPRMLTDAQKQTTLKISRVSLELLRQDSDRFFAQFTTMDEM